LRVRSTNYFEHGQELGFLAQHNKLAQAIPERDQMLETKCSDEGATLVECT
jgi:hypothetical protein